VRQGGPEPPILPYRIIDAARNNKRNKNYSGTIFNAGSVYADDLVLFFSTNLCL